MFHPREYRRLSSMSSIARARESQPCMREIRHFFSSSFFSFFSLFWISMPRRYSAYVFTRVLAGLGITDKSPFTGTRFSDEAIKSTRSGSKQIYSLQPRLLPVEYGTPAKFREGEINDGVCEFFKCTRWFFALFDRLLSVFRGFSLDRFARIFWGEERSVQGSDEDVIDRCFWESSFLLALSAA